MTDDIKKAIEAVEALPRLFRFMENQSSAGDTIDAMATALQPFGKAVIREAILQALLAAKSEWALIDLEAMPKNETVQLYSEKRGVTYGFVRKQMKGTNYPDEWSLRYYDDTGASDATHWQPLPPPPALQKGKGTSCE